MIRVTFEQFDRMKGNAERSYVDRVVRAISTRFREHAGKLGSAGTRTAVETAIAKGRGYGFVSEYDLFLFTCLSFAFGPGFDEDSTLPWAGATLHSRILGDPPSRLRRVYALALAATSQSGRPWVPLPPQR
ncbi:hypothetical protein HL658_08080 [Azospirillum sp. RWY-5-1]|uniref:Uncharacterized protein n=1 Tax=Azospirillum oleiclasticum TaxID=2735135 RepID=A0ABX2T5R2_9PROT|nr:hypothetical protein [Azospirillum oleiclasticum]NYZ12505.1 hypothetical protein [Azospirillum oleiclasticum]NYZ19665.1 hypothetical protein [Azospirillum oleiclasticum]